MLTIITKPEDLPYSALMTVYEQTICEKATNHYPCRDAHERLLLAEQDLYQYLIEALKNETAILALWSVQRSYVAALRLEKYRDGLLLTSLETAPDDRRKGYAFDLVCAVLSAYPDRKIYSHIYNSNIGSVMLHRKCGFRQIAAFAEFLDGSISHDASTFLYEKEQPALF